MGTTWRKMTFGEINDEITNPIKDLLERWTKLVEEAQTAGMTEIFTSFTEAHEDSLGHVSSCQITTSGSMNNQITSFRRGVKSDIEKNQDKNKKAKRKPPLPKKKPRK